MRKLPEPSTGARKLLLALLDGPGTFYQICERLDIDIESKRAEYTQREFFNRLVEGGHAYMLDAITYSITTPARNILAPAAPYVGQVAGPAYRREPQVSGVTIARRAAGARA